MSATTTMPRPPRPKRNDVVVKIDADVYRLIRTLAAYEGRPVAEVLTELVAPVVSDRLHGHGIHPKPAARKKPD